MNIAAVLKLTRWKEFLPWSIPLTLLGGLMAYQFAEITLDIRLLYVLIGNNLAMAYAFMINDIEDAEDDKHEAERAARNPVAMNEISYQQAWLMTLGAGILALVCFAGAGQNTFILGLGMVILAHLYSWKPVRLKALPVVDIVSHVLMLSALLYLTAYFAYDNSPGKGWWLVIFVTLASAYGQLYNQVRDYESDRAAGLWNTASLLGKPTTQLVSYLTVAIAALSLVISIAVGSFPVELLGVVLVTLPILPFVFSGRDARGDVTEDIVGASQLRFLLVANITLISWLIYILVTK